MLVIRLDEYFLKSIEGRHLLTMLVLMERTACFL